MYADLARLVRYWLAMPNTCLGNRAYPTIPVSADQVERAFHRFNLLIEIFIHMRIKDAKSDNVLVL